MPDLDLDAIEKRLADLGPLCRMRIDEETLALVARVRELEEENESLRIDVRIAEDNCRHLQDKSNADAQLPT